MDSTFNNAIIHTSFLFQALPECDIRFIFIEGSRHTSVTAAPQLEAS